MHPLSAAQILEKNKLSSTGVELVLLEIRLPDGRELCLCANTDDVTWDGREWFAFPFELGDMGEARGGEIPALELRVSNVTRAIQRYLEETDGGVGSAVVLRVVNSDLLHEPAMLELHFLCTAASASTQWVTFSLGASNPFRRRFPTQRILNNVCRYTRPAQCIYARDCEKTLAACRKHAPCSAADADYGQHYDGQARSVIFGGFPGCGTEAVYV